MSTSFSDLDTDPMFAASAEEIRKNAHVVNGGDNVVTCIKCRGSGRWGFSGRECFSCKGTGLVNKRKAAAAKGKITREKNWAAWCEEHATLIEGLRRHSWNNFLKGLLDQIMIPRILTERQMEAAYSAIARYDAAAEERRVTESASRSTEIGVSAIEALFNTAAKSGLKRPMFRTDKVAIKRSRKPEVLYVYDREAGGERGGYAGKIEKGVFIRTRSANPRVVEALQGIAADPAAAARAYGLSTGTCCLCARPLTDPDSVKAGIGPVCASNWGL